MNQERLTRATVLVRQHGLGALDYAVPDGMTLAHGDIVRVPLGPREVLGVVWDDGRLPTRAVDAAKLRQIAAAVPWAHLGRPLRDLIGWTADYYLADPGSVLRMALPSVGALDGPRVVTEYRPAAQPPLELTSKRAAMLETLSGAQASVRELAGMAGVGDGLIRALIGAGALEPVPVATDRAFPRPDPDHAPPVLSPAQAQAAAALTASPGFTATLLEGVTGSGKTEVYFEAVAAALRAGRQAVILLPEIALTAPLLARFAARFGCEPAQWHSDLKSSERRRTFRAAASGDAKVLIGARSALFLPYATLGLIIVDEAHESSYKQEDGVSYNARDAAVVRAKFEKIPCILATATPALETRAQVERGRYAHLILPDRHGGAKLPDVRVVDLRRTPPPRGRWLAPPLAQALTATLARGEQSLLFLNRRGYAPLTLCRTCGARIGCPNCSAWMVEHRLQRRLQCHHCGHAMPTPPACPSCNTERSLVACGPGVERIAEEVAATWPDARVALVTSDTLFTPARAASLVSAVETGAVDILIGTQMVTKGYHFPNLTLVGVVDADLGLAGGDLRAAERTHAQLAQVAGRAGRAEKPGQVFIQTHEPDAPVIRALARGDSDRFYAAEADARRRFGMPPYGRLAALIISGADSTLTETIARALADAAPHDRHVRVFGPAPAPLSMLRGRHRHRLLAHAARGFDLQGWLRRWLAAVPVPNSVRVAVDVDPYSFV